MNLHDDDLRLPKFIDSASLGKNGWLRYLIGSFLIVSCYFVTSVMADFALSFPIYDNVRITDPLRSYLILNLGHVGALYGLFLAIRFIHGRRFLTLITPKQTIDWKRIVKGLGVWAALNAVVCLVDYAVDPSKYKFVLNPGKFMVFAPIVLVLTPIQACVEELIFRGYLIQGAARWIKVDTTSEESPISSEVLPKKNQTKHIAFLAVLSGFLFMLPHLGNPEVMATATYPNPQAAFALMITYYFGVGFFLALVTMKSNSLEFAVGIHMAACLFPALIVNYEYSVLETESIFLCTKLLPDLDLISLIVMAGAAYPILLGRSEKTAKKRSPHERD